MNKEENIMTWIANIPNYKLLDSGENQKLEEICGIRITRSEPRAWWKKCLTEQEWHKAVAFFDKENQREWKLNGEEDLKKGKILDMEEFGIKIKISFSGRSKHIGIFPEQLQEWRWIKERITNYESRIVKEKQNKLKILNLFGYTGIASLVCANYGGLVTHVDGSIQSVNQAKENQKLSGLENAPIRWIVDDVLKFLKRETKRGVKYDAIIMDPPSYGKGPKGEIWKAQKDLVALLDLCKNLLSNDPQFIILNMYSIELSSISLKNLLDDLVKNLGGEIINGELVLIEETQKRLLPLSLFAIWSKRKET